MFRDAGARTDEIVLGAVPKVYGSGRENAVGSRYAFSLSVTGPLTPGSRSKLGGCGASGRPPPVSAGTSGAPLCKEMIPLACQPPAIQSTQVGSPFPNALPLPNGNS